MTAGDETFVSAECLIDTSRPAAKRISQSRGCVPSLELEAGLEAELVLWVWGLLPCSLLEAALFTDGGRCSANVISRLQSICQVTGLQAKANHKFVSRLCF